MPYQIIKRNSGYYVQNKITKKVYSNHPLSKIKALLQLKALYLHTHH